MVLMFAYTAMRSRTVDMREPSTGKWVANQNLFLRADNLNQILRESSYFAIMAVGATLVLVGGGVDLSIGSIYCLSAVVAAYFMSDTTYNGQIPISRQQELDWIAKGEIPGVLIRVTKGLLAGLGTGVLCGAVNGVLITTLKSPPFLITLGTTWIFRCAAFLITGGHEISSLPPEFFAFGQTEYAGRLTIHVPVMLAVVAFGWLYLRHSVPGRMSLAVGGNEEAARTAGLPVAWIKVLLYTIAGALGGLAGVLFIARSGAISSNDGRGYELNVIAAAVIGGASLTGGRGTAIGALLGALFLLQIRNALPILQIDQNYELLVIGMIIVAAAGANRLRERLLER